MKRFYILFVLCFEVAVSIAQTKHFSFLGITINGNTTSVFNQLINKGFTPSEQMDLMVEGTVFGIPGSTIFLHANYKTKQVYGMAIKFNAPSTEVFNRINGILQDYLRDNYKAESLTYFSDEFNYYFPLRCTKNGAEGIFFIRSSTGRANTKDWIELLVYDKANYLQIVYDKYIHVPFEGIPINGSTANFKSKMVAKGFRFVGNLIEEGDIGDEDRYYMSFKGSYYGYGNSNINVFYHKTNNRVYSVEVTVPRQSETTLTLAHTLDSRIGKTFLELKNLPLELKNVLHDHNNGIEKYKIEKTGLQNYNQPHVGYLGIEADKESHTVHISYTDLSSRNREY